jgi:deoxyribodipyrimidine photo-lyase
MSIFIFRRDFRIQDNRALSQLSEHGPIMPIFIFDPFQLDSNHIYFSQKSLDFMIDCLEELSKTIPLQFFKGEPSAVISDIIKNNNIKHIAFNADFSPYSKTRDAAIVDACEDSKVSTIIDKLDLILDHTEGDLPEISIVFGRYEKMDHNVQTPLPAVKNFAAKKLKSSYSFSLAKALMLRKSPCSGGRRYALEKIKNFKGYNKARDNVSIDTSRMSAYLKFGCVSIRELWHISKNPLYRRQLLWRSYYLITGACRTVGYGHVEKRFKDIKWSRSVKHAEALWTGNTGFPLIDASVRQLIKLGWMHNRARLAVANFSVKILHLNPFRDGSSMDYWSGQVQFSKYLIDCCWALNYGNWMWILGPYDVGGYRYGHAGTFGGRTFKDAIAPKKIDPDLAYIRLYVPELATVSDRDLSNWSDPKVRAKYPAINYEPIVSFESQLEKWYKMTTK